MREAKYFFKKDWKAVARRCSLEKVFFRNFAKFTGKHLYQGLFFNKVAGLRPKKASAYSGWFVEMQLKPDTIGLTGWNLQSIYVF